MEKIQSHEIKDIWRVRDGLLIEVNKYKSINANSFFIRRDSFKSKIVKGCKNLKVTTAEYEGENYSRTEKIVIPKGTFLLHDRPVVPETNPSNFTFDLKSSGGSIYGTTDEIEKVLADIRSIMDSYKS